MKTLQIICLSQAVTPITHMLGTVGNEAVINVEDVRTPLGVRKVPVLSGNAIRHRMLRAPSSDVLVERLELAGSLNRDELNLLYHGGLKREKGGRQSMARIAEMERLLPSLRLLGCCLPDGIVGGDLSAYRAMLVCRENRDRIKAMVPADWHVEASLAPATDFITRMQYVRGEVGNTRGHLVPEDEEQVDTMMPFAGTAVIAGSEWMHGFVIRNWRPIDVGCVLHSIRRWCADGATIGGQSSRGHGVLQLSYWMDQDVDEEACVQEYIDHIDSNADAIREFIHSLYRKGGK